MVRNNRPNPPVATDRKTKWFLYIAMTLMLFTGAGNTIFAKLQIEVKDSKGNKFTHAFFASFMVWVGAAISYLVYLVYETLLIRKYGRIEDTPEFREAMREGKKPYLHWFFPAIPALGDFMAIPMINLGLIMVNASVYQMMRGGIIFIIAIFSIIFLKSKLYRHHWASLFFIIGGVGLVGLSSILAGGGGNSNAVLGIILLLVSQFFSAGHWIIEEKFLRTYYIHPFRMIGLEGLWNLVFTGVLLTVAYFIKCDQSFWVNGRLEDTLQAFRQIGERTSILIYFIILILWVGTFQVSGLFVTKFGSAAQRCTIDISRIILIWGFFLTYPGAGHETFDIIEFIGFIGIVIGTIVFNEIYVPPLWNFDAFTKDNILKRESKATSFKLIEEDSDEPQGYLEEETKLNASNNEKSDSYPPSN